MSDPRSPGETSGPEVQGSIPPDFERVRQWVVVNDALDVLFFLAGLFLFVVGDAVEALVGGALDVFVFVQLFLLIRVSHRARPAYRGLLVVFLVLEFMDLTDFITLGAMDLFGWIEVIPFWWIFTLLIEDDFIGDEEWGVEGEPDPSQETSPGREIAQPSTPLMEPQPVKCRECGATVPVGATYCERCGKRIVGSNNLPES